MDSLGRSHGRFGVLRFLALPRLLVGAALLAGLFALLVFVLRPGGGEDAALPPARLLDAPAGPDGVSTGVHAGDLARDFEAPDLAGALHRLSDLRGRPVIVNFWASWCASCRAELPALQRLVETRAFDRVAVVAVNVGERLGDARRFIEALRLDALVIALDPGLDISDAYGVGGLPHSLFIDAHGVIQAEYLGPLEAEVLGRYVQAAIDGARGEDPPFTLRFVTTVPREHVLEVVAGSAPGELRLVSRRFRCDDGYCADVLVDRIQRLGIERLELSGAASPPELLVRFDPALIGGDAVVAAVAEALRAHPDPLYTGELEIRVNR
jgi:thiol-disulfide isomerase/thioredoxin